MPGGRGGLHRRRQSVDCATVAKVVIDYVAGLFMGMSSDDVVFKVQSGVAFEAA